MNGKYRYTASEVDEIIARNRTLDRGPVVIGLTLAALSGAISASVVWGLAWWWLS